MLWEPFNSIAQKGFHGLAVHKLSSLEGRPCQGSGGSPGGLLCPKPWPATAHTGPADRHSAGATSAARRPAAQSRAGGCERPPRRKPCSPVCRNVDLPCALMFKPCRGPGSHTAPPWRQACGDVPLGAWGASEFVYSRGQREPKGPGLPGAPPAHSPHLGGDCSRVRAVGFPRSSIHRVCSQKGMQKTFSNWIYLKGVQLS